MHLYKFVHASVCALRIPIFAISPTELHLNISMCLYKYMSRTDKYLCKIKANMQQSQQ